MPNYLALRHLRFILLILLYILLSYSLLRIIPKGVINTLSLFTARIVVGILRTFGVSVYLDKGIILSDKGAGFEIIDECTGLFEILIYISGISAYPASVKARLIGLLGIIIIYTFNILRLVGLFFFQNLSPAYFELVHSYLWNIIFIGVLIATWICWLEFIVHNANEP